MTEDIITRIEQAIGCQQCAEPLAPDGPSADFCGEACQRSWHQARLRLSQLRIDIVQASEMFTKLAAAAEAATAAVAAAFQDADRPGWLSRWIHRVFGGGPL